MAYSPFAMESSIYKQMGQPVSLDFHIQLFVQTNLFHILFRGDRILDNFFRNFDLFDLVEVAVLSIHLLKNGDLLFIHTHGDFL
ncbi:hypothetical protein NCCP2331_20600 [Sporosarcina sp. NCCP-2331]|nr:hypothetical protein NCCP2331_20600 [Sporosarcina sp. NCCP-2331]GLB56093.1 hypothetical protein NCCP2378_18800 [Sporosarcina sp. NCCP-2378]